MATFSVVRSSIVSFSIFSKLSKARQPFQCTIIVVSPVPILIKPLQSNSYTCINYTRKIFIILTPGYEF